MEKAINTKKEMVYAFDVSYGIYFCPECADRVYWREIPGRAPHFYHFRHNKLCSLSTESTSGYFIIGEYINILKTNYRERWMEAIKNIIQYDFLNILCGKEWALNPLEYYIDKSYDSMDIDIFIRLLSVIIIIDNEKADDLFYKFLDLTNLNQNEKCILEDVIKNSMLINRELYDAILNNITFKRQMKSEDSAVITLEGTLTDSESIWTLSNFPRF
jgi:hypothetical protein